MTDRDRLGADSLREIREALETGVPTPGVLMDDGSPHFTDEALVARMRFLQHGYRWCAALVAEREALLERIQELEDGGHGSAVSRGEVAGVSPFRQPKLQEIP